MRIVDVADPADARLDDIRDLNHPERRPDLPGGRGLVVAEGVFVVGRMLLSRFRPHLLVGTASRFDRLRADAAAEGWNAGAALAAAGDPPCLRVSRELLGEVIGFRSTRDLFAVARAPEPLTVDEALDSVDARTVVVLEGVNDPENIGSIFRGVAALGADTVLFGASTGDPLYRRVVRVSMGHVLRVPFAHLGGTPTTWQRGLDALHRRGFRSVALTPSGDRTVAEALADGPERVALVVGAEGPGLTEHAMRACSVRAGIPMAPGTDSLNVATAATLALYERMRR